MGIRNFLQLFLKFANGNSLKPWVLIDISKGVFLSTDLELQLLDPLMEFLFNSFKSQLGIFGLLRKLEAFIRLARPSWFPSSLAQRHAGQGARAASPVQREYPPAAFPRQAWRLLWSLVPPTKGTSVSKYISTAKREASSLPLQSKKKLDPWGLETDNWK